MIKKISWAFHFLAYYSSWLGCIYLALLDYSYLSAVWIIGFLIGQIFWQILLGFPWMQALWYALFLTVLGALTDTLWLKLKWIYFNANPFSFHFAPLWMMALWLSFGFNLITLYHVERTSGYLVLGLVTALSLPLAYFVGIELGAAFLLQKGFKFYLALGLSWAVLLPLSLFIFNRFKDRVR